jgi:hypothetical protein
LFLPAMKSAPIDFIVHKNQNKMAVSCLRWAPGHEVTEKVLQGIVLKSRKLHCERLIVFASSTFNTSAREFSEKNSVYLIGREKFMELVQALAQNKVAAENHILQMEQAIENQSSFYLEGDIRSVKTKVRIAELHYHPNRDDNLLVFEGIVHNTGKSPVRKLSANLVLLGRESGIIENIRQPIGDGYLDVENKATFQCLFPDMTKYQWADVCRFRIKLSYQNI